MKNKPELQLIGHDGNIYAIMGSAARLLRQNGMKEESDEMFQRVTSSGRYEEALGIVSPRTLNLIVPRASGLTSLSSTEPSASLISRAIPVL